MRKPSVKTRCVANYHAAANERIVEFSFPSGHGGLISFRTLADGREIVNVYMQDPPIEVISAEPRRR